MKHIKKFESNSESGTENLEKLPQIFVNAFKEYIAIEQEIGERYMEIDLDEIETPEQVFDEINNLYYKGVKVDFLKFILTNRDSQYSFSGFSEDGRF